MVKRLNVMLMMVRRPVVMVQRLILYCDDMRRPTVMLGGFIVVKLGGSSQGLWLDLKELRVDSRAIARFAGVESQGPSLELQGFIGRVKGSCESVKEYRSR
eukprot:1215884-Amorphochlora_amoeboformis.AAC.1